MIYKDKLWKRYSEWLSQTFRDSDEDAIEYLITAPEEDHFDIYENFCRVLKARLGDGFDATEILAYQDSCVTDEVVNKYITLLGFDEKIKCVWNNRYGGVDLPNYKAKHVIVRIDENGDPVPPE